jgi:hypothetical protein
MGDSLQNMAVKTLIVSGTPMNPMWRVERILKICQIG